MYLDVEALSHELEELGGDVGNNDAFKALRDKVYSMDAYVHVYTYMYIHVCISIYVCIGESGRVRGGTEEGGGWEWFVFVCVCVCICPYCHTLCMQITAVCQEHAVTLP